MVWLILAFIGIPVIEMIVLIEVGSVIGSVSTVALVFLTAIAGVLLLKRQGLQTLITVNRKLASGELPATEILSAVFLAMAGVLLLTPGFVTDTLGFLMLVSPFRHWLADYLIRKGVTKTMAGFEQGVFVQRFEHFYEDADPTRHSADASVERLSEHESAQSEGETLDGDFERKDS